MRILDLLQLMQDYAKNTPVRLRAGGKDVLIDTFTQRTVNEQPQLIFHPKTAGKPLKLWEFMVLLDKKTLRQHFVYVAEPSGDIRPLFGVQDVNGTLVIN